METDPWGLFKRSYGQSTWKHDKKSVTGGPKNNAFKLAKPQDDGTTPYCKVRGITFNFKDALQINLKLLKKLL